MADTQMRYAMFTFASEVHAAFLPLVVAKYLKSRYFSSIFLCRGRIAPGFGFENYNRILVRLQSHMRHLELQGCIACLRVLMRFRDVGWL